jgi:sulfotransferase family protein
VTRLPNFLYIGPDKAGSSWLHEVLLTHPQVFMTPAKDLYYFDRYYDKGTDWYAAHFARAADEPVVGEVCQDYLFCAEAPQRIAGTLESPRFMVTLRDPVDRAFSSYLYMLKMGEQPGTFSEALTGRPELLEHGRYGRGLDGFADRFGEESVLVTVFDDLVADPRAFVGDVYRFLGVEPLPLTDELMAARLPASKARSVGLARLARAAADWTREHDGAAVVGRVKRAPIVQRVLYQPLKERPQVEEADVARIRDELDSDVRRAEERFGVKLRERWGWL